MDDKLVSVVIPTYKREVPMVKRCIQSVLEQTYSKIEIIIVDDSPSSFVDRVNIENMILKINDDRIKYIKNEENRGACFTRNVGIRNANGEFIAFLDDDDVWLSEKIEKQLACFNNKKIGLVYCPAYIVDSEEKTTNLFKGKLYSGNIFHELMYENFIGSTSFVMIRKAALLECGLFTLDLQSNQDWELYLRIAQIYEINYIDEALVKYYVHNGERISGNPEKKINGINYMMNKHKEYLIQNKDVKAKWLIHAVPHYIRSSRYLEATRMIFNSVILSPKVTLEYMIDRFVSSK